MTLNQASYQPNFDHHSYYLPPINTTSLVPTSSSNLTYASIIQHQKMLDPKQWDANDVSQVNTILYRDIIFVYTNLT
jgi:hypothetical protein